MATSLFTREPASAASRPNTRPVGWRVAAPRQRQTSWILLGVLLVFGAGLGVALWSSTITERRTVVVTAHPIDAGATIHRDDLREASINADAAVTALPATAIDKVVGKVARGPIPAGTPLQDTMVADAAPVPSGMVVVGAALAAGDYPTANLRAGDTVQVVETTVGAPTGAASKVLTTATVWAVDTSTIGGERRMFVSIVVPDTQGAAVANAAATNRLRLLLTGAR